MRSPPLPHTEAQRLKSLHRTGLLDSQFEDRFDRITRVASHLFDVPIALVSLVDQHRQWFKASVGLEARETPREISFCGHAILDRGVFCVEDASLDSRFQDNPLVVDDPGIRFYAGCPLHDSAGLALGTLCVIDRKPRKFAATDLRSLRDLAAMAETEISLSSLQAETGRAAPLP